MPVTSIAINYLGKAMILHSIFSKEVSFDWHMSNFLWLLFKPYQGQIEASNASNTYHTCIFYKKEMLLGSRVILETS
jgi:hypothetical protein